MWLLASILRSTCSMQQECYQLRCPLLQLNLPSDVSHRLVPFYPRLSFCHGDLECILNRSLLAGTWWCRHLLVMPLAPICSAHWAVVGTSIHSALRRQREVYLCVQGQSGLQSKVWDSQGSKSQTKQKLKQQQQQQACKPEEWDTWGASALGSKLQRP